MNRIKFNVCTNFMAGIGFGANAMTIVLDFALKRFPEVHSLIIRLTLMTVLTALVIAMNRCFFRTIQAEESAVLDLLKHKADADEHEKQMQRVLEELDRRGRPARRNIIYKDAQS